MSKIAVIIKTTSKRKSLLWVLNSIELSLNNYRIYIADDDPIDDWKKDLYEKLCEEGHYIKIWNNSKSVTKARNYLISQLQEEEYVMRIDDDFELGGEFNIENMLTILEKDDIDYCAGIERQVGKGKGKKSGEIRIESGKIKFRSEKVPRITLKDDNSWSYSKFNGVRYARADFMRNLILIKRKCFDKVEWEESLEFEGEHADFYLSLKANGFKGAFTPDSIHLHRDDLKSLSIDLKSDKLERKANGEKVKNVFTNKWGGYPDIDYVGFDKFKNKTLPNNIKKLKRFIRKFVK